MKELYTSPKTDLEKNESARYYNEKLLLNNNEIGDDFGVKEPTVV